MYLLNVLFYKQHNLNLRCKNSMWFYDVVYFFLVWKALLELCFHSSDVHIRFFFVVLKKNESLVMLSNQNTTFIVCMLVNDWEGLGFNGLVFFSHWMMLVQVFLILMCIIFEHGSVAFTVGAVPSCSRSWTLLEDLEALLGCVTDRRVCVELKESIEACHVIAKPSQLISVTCTYPLPPHPPSLSRVISRFGSELHLFNCKMP